jgi:hypothetical protein
MYRFVALVTLLGVISMMVLLSLDACGQQGKESHAEASQPQSPAEKERVNLIPYRKGEKWGFSDAKKKLMIEPQYNFVFRFSEDLASVVLRDKYGFIDKAGKVVIPLKYDNAGSFVEGLAKVELNDKWGFIDKTGKVVIPLKYDEVDPFSEGSATVTLNKKQGLIDKSGKELTQIKYDEVSRFFEGLAVVVQLNGKSALIDKSGKELVLPPEYYLLSPFSEGRAAVGAVVGLKQKVGFIDKTGKEVIPLTYDRATAFHDGLSMVERGTTTSFIDTNGNEVFSLKDRFLVLPTDHFSEGLCPITVSSDKFGFIDKTGKVVIPLKYDLVDLFSEGLAKVTLNNKDGFIDQSGKELIPLKYDRVEWFSEGLAGVELNGKWGFIDKSGKEVIALKYLEAYPFDEGLAEVQVMMGDSKREFKTLNEAFRARGAYVSLDGTEYFEP